MRPVKIEYSLKDKDCDWYFLELYTLNSIFSFEYDTEVCIENMPDNDKLTSLYVLYKIIKNDNLLPNINLKPNRGILFRNRNKKDILSNDLLKYDPLGIYHCHLNNDMVLIWYIEKNLNNFIIRIKYIKHPSDNYKNILTEIYKNDLGYNLIKMEYFKDYFKNVYLSERKYIFLNFNEYSNIDISI